MFNKVWNSLFGEDKEILKNREIASLKEEFNSLKKELLKDLSQERQKKNQEINSLKIEIKKLTQENLKKDKEINSLNNNIYILKNKLTTLENKNIAIYNDKEIEKLKNKIKSLEIELQNISEEKNEITYKIENFNNQYNLYLGEIIEKVLKIKEEFYYKQFQNSQNEDDYQEYEQIKESYEEFHNNYEDIVEKEKNKGTISNDDLKELKKIFRQTVKLCHPDIVEEHLKSKANTIMQELNSAYARLDIDGIRKIFDKLENGLEFVKNEKIDNKDSLIKKIDKLKIAIKDEEKEIEDIKQSDIYLLFDSLEYFEEFFESQKKEFEDEYEYILTQLNNLKQNDNIEDTSYIDIMEDGEYSQKLRDIDSPNFDKIRRVCINYINSHPNSEKLHNNLDRGVKILDSSDELYQYIFSFGKMHKAKLYNSFDTVIEELNHKTINVIDYGCGQALASSLLIDYIKENSFDIDISNINLIEPSTVALSRGVLHIDVLKDNHINIKAINKDIDSLIEDDLIFDNGNITLHLFSNILDVKFFDLDIFIEKISNSQNGLNYFISVSPNIGDSRNNRLDIFYQYFNNNFDIDLISKRDCDINNYKRYEIIFKAEL